jgi:purine catabolism regulator
MNNFTVEEFLKTTSIKGLRLVAGEKGIKNPIVNVNTIDNPESYEWFTAGDFLLTTGYIYQDDSKLQKQLIQELSELNCAGLGVKIKRFWDKIPETILQEANKVDLPIIEIPYIYSLAQLTNTINTALSKRENSLLNKYKNIHEVFNQISLEDGDFTRIVKTASELIGNPVLLVDSNFRLLSYHELPDNKELLSNHLPLTINERSFTREFTQDIPKSTDEFSLSIKRKFPNDNGDITCRIIPIAYANDLYGYLVAWETIRKLQSTDYVALETAAITAAIRQLKLQQIQESRARMQESFFDDLLQNRILSVSSIENLAKLYGISTNQDHVIAVIDLETVDASRDKILQEIIEEKIAFYKKRVQMFKRHNDFVLIIEVDRKQKRKEQNDAVREFISVIDTQVHAEIPTCTYRIGVGSIISALQFTQRSYTLALEVLRLSQKMDDEDRVHYFSDFIGYHLLDQHIQQKDLLEFFHEILGPLDAHDAEHNANLLETLDVYFKSNANLSDAAKAMFIHRNTLIYRIDKIKQILNTDLKDSEENFVFMMALHIMKIINK